MGDDAFDEKILTEKLSKLNSSQQSIESLSKWCVSHRKKARQVVENWERVFKSVAKEQQVSLLYLANDILQNSRRKGSEFVTEFWKVLPVVLRGVYESGDGNCRKIASRLVAIWEERKVFGSRGQNLENELKGTNPSQAKIPSPVNDPKKSNPIKVVKKDDSFLRIKLAVGCLPEKILTAFQLLHDEILNEEGALNECKNTISSVQELEKDVVQASSQGNVLGADVVDDIQKQEDMLLECISQLENYEAIRVTFASQLKEALDDQESKLEQIRNELLVARGQIKQTTNMKLQLTSTVSAPPTTIQLTVGTTFSSALPTSNPTVHPVTSFINSLTEEGNKKATAADIAAKLAASASSAQMFTSVLSSLVAEEAASMSKRPRLETPAGFSDANSSEGGGSVYFAATQQSMTNMPPVQVSQLQAPFLVPPAPAPPANSQSNQLQPGMMAGLPYGGGYGATNLPAAASNVPMGFAMPGPPPQQHQQQQQLQAGNGRYFRPAGIGFYGQTTHQPSTPPIHRQ